MRSLARPRDHAEVLRRLGGVRPESRARWGRMSAHQMVCHLRDAFLMMTGEKAVRTIGGIANRTFVRFTALYLPLRWPPGIQTMPEIDQEIGGTPPENFGADLARLTDILAEVPDRRDEIDSHAHPVFGRLSPSAWMRWGFLHMDHHLRQFGV